MGLEEKKKILSDITDDIKEIINPLKSKSSKIGVLKSEIDKYGTKVVELCGGLNGRGEWDDYFADLSNIVKEVRKKYDIWLIKLDNDCADDIFYADFGVGLKKNE